MILNDEELSNVYGGGSLLTGTFLNAVTRMFSTLLDVGRAIGSAIVRHHTKNYCI